MDGDDGSTDTLADQFDNVVGAASDENLRQEIDELVDGDDDALPSAVNGERDEHFERPYDHDDDLSGGSVADSGSSGSMGGGGGGEADAAGSTLVAALSEAAAADAGVAPDAPDSMLRPLEEFYRQAIMSSSGRFPSKDALLYSKDPRDLLYFGQQLSLYAKKMKSVYNRKRTETTQSTTQYRWANNQVVVIFLNFHQLAVAKFQQIARQDPRQRLAFVCLPENDVSEDKYHTPNAIEASAVVPGASLIDIPGMPPSQYSFSSSSSSSTSSSSSSFATSVSSFSEAHYPILEVAYSWGLAAFRYGKALQRQHDAEAAHKHFHQAAKLMQYIIEEETSPRTWTVLVFKKLPKVLESIAQVRPSDSEIRNYCDAFLIHFSNIAMRGEIEDLSLKPLIALCLSENRYIRACKPVDIVRHLATFFDSNIAAEASRQLSYLETILKRTEDKELELKRALTAKAKKQLQESGITKEEMMDNLDVLLRLINWKGAPPCRLPFDPVPLQEGETDHDLIWLLENPRKFYTDRYKLSLDDDVPNATIYLAKRKSDGAPVAIKVIKKYSLYEESIKKEVEWVKSLRFQVFAHLLDVYLHSDEVWIVLEYCNGGNLVDLLPVSTFTEGMIAYIVREVLKGLEYLHSRNRMHRDLTSDDILMNLDGEVMLVDFEVWLDKSNTRYWLAPELLLSEPFPYGCEVDIWSLGCIIIEMADGRPPYSAFHPLKEFFYTATKGAPTLENPAQWSLHFRNFLAAALRPDPSKRATATELLQHPFIALACTREEFALAVQQRVSFTKW